MHPVNNIKLNLYKRKMKMEVIKICAFTIHLDVTGNKLGSCAKMVLI